LSWKQQVALKYWKAISNNSIRLFPAFMKKQIYFLSLATVALLAGNACKKEKGEPVNAYAGKYSLISETNINITTGHSDTYTNVVSPCISDNQTTLKGDGTWTAAYVGAEDCYVSRTDNSYTIIGQKGASASGSWVQSGNRIKFTLSNKSVSYGVVSNVGGKVQLTFKDTSQYFISTSVLMKQ